MGCDDYIKKPFYIFELIQKVKKLCSPTSSKYELTSNTIFDIKQQKLYINGVEVFLTKKRFYF